MATVRRCIDCDELLVDDAPADAGEVTSSAAPIGDGGQVGYELAGWGNQLKVTLEGMLDRAGVPRAWEAGALLVPSSQEATVDALIATVEGDDASVLDEAVERVALEIEGLDADDRSELDARLLADGIVHVWDDGGDLVVAEADEEHVLSIIEDVFERGATSEADELATQEALSDLYVAVDRLVKDPHDAKLATRYQRSAAVLVDLSVPYGFSNADWSDLLAEVTALSARLDPAGDHVEDEPQESGRASEDDEELSDLERDTRAAHALRDRLVDLV